MSHIDGDRAEEYPTPTVDRDHDDGTTIVITGDLLADLFGGAG